MRLFVLLATIGFSFIFLACGQRQNAQGQHNPVGIEPSAPDSYTWDFQEVVEGEVATHDFVFKNESQDTLNIKEVTTSCGCTVTKLEKKTLLPEEETFIEVKFNSKGYKGNVRQFVYVHTDSLDEPIVRYIIKVNVIAR
ncbi:MAG: DUF1573 domain-containing protein [Candidatus Omnitrophota bacterium]